MNDIYEQRENIDAEVSLASIYVQYSKDEPQPSC